MAKKKPAPGPSLFDTIERDMAREEAVAGNCKHQFETATEAVWPDAPQLGERMVWRCDTCSRLRGRC